MTVAAISIDTAEPDQSQANLPVVVGTTHAPARRHSLLRRVAPAVLIAAVLGGGGYAGWAYWTQWRFEVSTDDAYVQADTVMIAPQVAATSATCWSNPKA